MRFVEILDKMHLKFFPNFTFTLHHLMTHICLIVRSLHRGYYMYVATLGYKIFL